VRPARATRRSVGRPVRAGRRIRGEDSSARFLPDRAGRFRLRVGLVESGGHGWVVGDGCRRRTAHDSSTVAVAESGVWDAEIECRLLHFGGEDLGGGMVPVGP
jgi:hypothetical protein